MTDGKNFFDQPVNSSIKTYEDIRKVATEDDYMTGCLLDYSYFKDHYKMIAIYLSKQHSKLLMLIQERFNKLILPQIWIEQEIQQCSLLLKRQKKLI